MASDEASESKRYSDCGGGGCGTVLLGAVVVGLAMWFVIQWIATLGREDDVSTFIDIVGIGPVAAILGGGLMLSGR